MKLIKTILLIFILLMSVVPFAAYAEEGENNTDTDTKTRTSAETSAQTDLRTCMDKYKQENPDADEAKAKNACARVAISATTKATTARPADESTVRIERCVKEVSERILDVADAKRRCSSYILDHAQCVTKLVDLGFEKADATKRCDQFARVINKEIKETNKETEPVDRLSRCMTAVAGVINDQTERRTFCTEIKDSRDICIQKLAARNIDEEKAKGLCDRYLGTPVAVAGKIDARADQIKARFDGVLRTQAERIEQNEQLTEEQKTKMLERIEKLELISAEKRDRLDNRTLFRLQHIEENRMNRIASLPQADLEKLAKLDRATQERLLEKDASAIRAELSRFKEVKATQKEELLQKREIIKSERDRLKLAYDEFKDTFKEQRDELKKLRDDFIKNKDGERSIEAAKAYLNKAVDVAITDIEVIKQRVLQSDDLEQSTVDAVVAKLDAEIAELKAVKENIASATTKEELKVIAQDLHKKWNAVKHRLEHAKKALLHAKMGEVITRSKYLEAKLDRILVRMEESGKDTTQVNALAENFSMHIAKANQDFKDAKNMIILAILKADDNASRSEIERLLKSAHEELKTSHEILKQIMRMLREEKVSLAVSDADISLVIEEEIEVEAESTDAETEVETQAETAAEIEANTEVEVEASSQSDNETTVNTQASVNVGADVEGVAVIVS